MAYEQALPPGTELNGEFRIQGLLGSGGFANTYLAMDLTLGREVAIKEFFPAELAVRMDSKSVSVKSGAQSNQFEWARSRFVREAKTLAKFRHPSVVRVFRVFDANNTAYIVLEFVRGANMGTWLKRLQRPPSQDEFDILLPPLLDALEVVHAAGILHRDIKPANIYIREVDQMPVLLDFGAAKYASTAENAGTTAAIVSKGYSPNEAYSTDTRLQGPWTDIYGLSATIYRALTGSAPPESTSRILHDECVRATEQPELQGLYRPEFLAAVDRALEIIPKDRPQSIGQWRKELIPNGDLIRPAANPIGFGPTDSEWKPLSDSPAGTETIYSANPPGSSGSQSGEDAPHAWPSAPGSQSPSGNRSGAPSSPEMSAGRTGEDERRKSGPRVPVAQVAAEAVSAATRTARNLSVPALSSQHASFYGGLALVLGGGGALAFTMFAGQPNDTATKLAEEERVRVERLAALDTQAVAERERMAELRRLAAERAAIERAARETIERRQAEEARRLAEEEAERQRAAESKRLAEEAAERRRAAEAKRLAEEAAERRRAAEAKRLAEAEAERQRAAEAKRLAEVEAERQRTAEAKRLAEAEAERKRAAEAKRLAEAEAERRRAAEAKRLAEAEAERQRAAEAKRVAEAEAEAKRVAEAKAEADRQAELRRQAEVKKRIAEENARKLAEREAALKTQAAGPTCGGLYSKRILDRCEASQPERLCECAADLEIKEVRSRRYEREAGEMASITTGTEVQVAALSGDKAVPSADVRHSYVTEMQTLLKEQRCYDGQINGRIEDAAPAIEKFSSKTGQSGPKIELARATKAEYEDWLRWFRRLDRHFCVPLPSREPDAKSDDRVTPKAAPQKQRKTKPRQRSRPKKPRTLRRAQPRRTKPKRSASQAKPPSSSSSRNSLLRGGR